MKFNTKMVGYTVITDAPTESKLREFAEVIYNENLNVCKYYNDDEERIIDIPDVIDLIDDKLSYYDDVLSRVVNGARDTHRYIPRSIKLDTPKKIKSEIERIEAIRDKVLDERAEFYIQTESLVDAFNITRVKLVRPKLYKAVFNMKTLCFDAVECDTIEALLIGDFIYIGKGYNLVNANTWHLDTATIESYYFGIDKESVEKFTNLPEDEPKWKLCKDCGTPFRIDSITLQWYLDKGFTEPKRCLMCRNLRKRQKEWDQEVEIGRKDYIYEHHTDEGFDPVAYMGRKRPE